MRVSEVLSTGWFPVVRAADVGTRPVPVGAGGQAFVVVRLRPGAEVNAFPARCPHRGAATRRLVAGAVAGPDLDAAPDGHRDHHRAGCLRRPGTLRRRLAGAG